MNKWIQEYLTYTDESECPEQYLIWSSLSTIASALGRKVWVDMGFFRIYPNMFIVLIGPPGVRKTTAIRISTSLLEEFPDIHISADSITREALIKALRRCESQIELDKNKIYVHSSLTIVTEELSVFLKSNDKDFMSILTAFYDCKNVWEYETISRGINPIIGIWLHMFGASTSDWFVESIPISAIGGGFTSRIIFVVAYEPRKRIAIPKLTDAAVKARANLIKEIERMTQLKGQFQFEGEAKEWFVNWYETRDEPLKKDKRFAGYVDRKHIHLLKVAMLLCASESDDMVLKPHHLIEGLELIENIETNMPGAYGSFGRNILAQDIDAVIHIIRENKMVNRKQLIRNIWRDVNPKDVDIVVKTLHDMEVIKTVHVGGEQYYVYIKEE